MKVWSVAQLNKERALSISEQFGIPMICAALLDVRGINTPEAVEAFLSDELSFDNPFDIKDMDKAVERITRAVENGEKICIYGDYDADGVTSTALLYSYLETIEVSISEDEVIANIPIEGELKNANVEVIFNEKGLVTSMTTNVERTFGELMTNAALNTLLGMGTVFAVLILISFIISAFGLISKVEDALKNKASKKEIKEEAVNNTIAQIEEREELADDLELVAVIAAAIASYEGTSTDGFVVRSIRKANRNKWLNA